MYFFQEYNLNFSKQYCANKTSNNSDILKTDS